MLLGAADAGAGTLTTSDRKLIVTADPGETNDAVAERDAPATSYIVRDDGAPLTVGGGCVNPHEAVCSIVDRRLITVTVSLGDQDDTGELRVRSSLLGEDGADTLLLSSASIRARGGPGSPAQKRLKDEIAWSAAVPQPESRLAECVEGLVSYEHAAWASEREEASGRIGGPG